MKILVLSYEYPPIGGGGGIICKNISENLTKLGNQVTILTTAFLQSAIRNPHSAIRIPHSALRDLKIVRLPARRKNAFQSNPLEMLSWIRVTKRFIRNNPGFIDFDICMAHFVLPGGEVANWLKKKYRLPYVLISHGHEIPWVHPRQMFFFHMGAYCRIKKVCKDSAINFIQTRKMKNNIDRFLGRKYGEKNVIIPNGVDTTRYFPDISKRTRHLRILFIGRLVIQKDPMIFLKALKIFSQETTDFEVHIIGDGNLRKKMERFVNRNRLSGHVKFLGKILDENMAEEYQTAHLMVAPSLNEGMSISALEALSCGVYLIATRASGFEDMIRENVNGEFVNFRDPENIAKKLIKFHQRNMIGLEEDQNRLKRTSNPDSWNMISKGYLELFGTLLKK